MDLAARIEAGEAAGRRLEAEIALALGWTTGVLGQAGTVWYEPDGRLRGAPDRWTKSLDAATSLFAEDTMYRSGHSALASDPAHFFCDAVTATGTSFHALADTEPLARLAAALRTRSVS
jgi:hypothetical protein